MRDVIDFVLENIMLVVLSDLHFSEAQSTKIGEMAFNKNLPPETYHAFLKEINQIAVANRIKKVDLVLAGDILEITRSRIWFEYEERPYQDNSAIKTDSMSEAIILRIIDAIQNEEHVRETLGLFKDIQALFDMEVSLHYLLGNHDRLVNATPKIRKAVREIFGLSGGETRFDHQYLVRHEDGSTFCMVRHGHEYDAMNFSVDTRKLDIIPTEFPNKVYGAAPLGDISTIEFGAALPYYFVAEYGEKRILSEPHLLALYERLLAFDDVRPSSALLSYILSTPGVKKRETWEYMKPCFSRLFKRLAETPGFLERITQSSRLSNAQRLFIRGLLTSKLLIRDVPYWMIRQLMKQVSKEIKLLSPVKWAKKEALIKDKKSKCKCVISGHTHVSEVSLMSAKQGDERYYINTGTWRNTIPATKNFQEFGRVNAITKVIVFQPSENLDSAFEGDWSFHFLTGVSFGDNRHI